MSKQHEMKVTYEVRQANYCQDATNKSFEPTSLLAGNERGTRDSQQRPLGGSCILHQTVEAVLCRPSQIQHCRLRCQTTCHLKHAVAS